MIMMSESYPAPGSSPSLPVSAALPTSSGFSDSLSSAEGPPPCTGCGQPIQDEFILRVQGHLWHAHCLRCAVCQVSLAHTCYVRGMRVFCRVDFYRLFGASCAGCGEVIPPTEVVRRAHENIYHLRCFACVLCGLQFHTGDEFYLREDGHLLCKNDFRAARNASGQDDSGGNNTDPSCPQQFPHHNLSSRQVDVLREISHTCPNPSPDTVQQISAEHGIDVRSVRAWFTEQHMQRSAKLDGARGTGQSTEYSNVGVPTSGAPGCHGDYMDRVVAPPGGYPLPIVNEAISGSRLPASSRSQLSFDFPPHPSTYPKSPCTMTMCEDLWNPNFVPPNVDLNPCDIKNGEVCDSRRGLTPVVSSTADSSRGVFTFSAGRGGNCGGQQQQHQSTSHATGMGVSWINC